MNIISTYPKAKYTGLYEIFYTIYDTEDYRGTYPETSGSCAVELNNEDISEFYKYLDKTYAWNTHIAITGMILITGEINENVR